ncbi:HAMP domain-containing sensor histidine kinase [soil metagenome]
MAPTTGEARKLALIVDDDPIQLELLAAKLSEDGFSVVRAMDGEEAGARLEGGPYALAVIDLSMPRLDGFGLLRQIRQHPQAADIPVIVATTSGDKDSIERAYRLGASSFVTKPINWSQFLHHVRFVVRNGEIERELREARMVAESASRLKTSLFHVLSHELRTPIASLIGFTDLLTRSLAYTLDKRDAEHLSHVAEAAQRLNVIVSDILIYSRALGGRSQLEIHDCDITELAEQAVFGHQAAALAKRVTLDLRVELKKFEAACDSKLIRRALSNLIDNAIRFSPIGGTVVVSVHGENDGAIVLSVRDNGPGVTGDQLAELLQPFVQGDTGYGRRFEGMGLGLPIARSIVEAHGGALTCESKAGAGMVASLWLPALRPVLRATG